MNDERENDAAAVPPKRFSLRDHPEMIAKLREWSTPGYRPYMGENEPDAIENRRLVLEEAARFGIDEPWELPPIPSRCGTPWVEWMQETSEQRQADWRRKPASWYESYAARHIAYWSARPDSHEMKRCKRAQDSSTTG